MCWRERNPMVLSQKAHPLQNGRGKFCIRFLIWRINLGIRKQKYWIQIKMFEYFTLFIVPFVRNIFVYQIRHEKEIRSTYEINTLQNGKCFERFLFTRWYVLLKKKSSFVRCTHSIVSWYFSTLNVTYTHFTSDVRLHRCQCWAD